jgi:ATP-dependent protease HslVU (ClpYQ) peptidase subunit
MTTICFDGVTLASDSRTTGNYVEDNTKKLYTQGNRHYGFAGSLTSSLSFLQWSNNRTVEKPKLDDDFEIIEVEGGKAFYYDSNLVKTPASIPCAIGSGCHLAMAAILCGKTAKQAIEIAKKLDEGTGGKVQTIKV